MGMLLFVIIVISIGFIIACIMHAVMIPKKVDYVLGNLVVLDDPVDGERYMTLEVYSKAALDALKDGDEVKLNVIFPPAKNTSSVMDN